MSRFKLITPTNDLSLKFNELWKNHDPKVADDIWIVELSKEGVRI